MDKYNTTEEVALACKLSPKTLETWRSRGQGPQYCKVGGRVLYLREDVEEFIESKKIKTRGSRILSK